MRCYIDVFLTNLGEKVEVATFTSWPGSNELIYLEYDEAVQIEKLYPADCNQDLIDRKYPARNSHLPALQAIYWLFGAIKWVQSRFAIRAQGSA